MAIFFFVVGLEITCELLVGVLAGWQRAALPVVGAPGGMVVPAAIYAWLNLGQPTIASWGVPMATNIAFAVGILALLGPRVPLSPKILLLAFAIVDDLGAVHRHARLRRKSGTRPGQGRRARGLGLRRSYQLSGPTNDPGPDGHGGPA